MRRVFFNNQAIGNKVINEVLNFLVKEPGNYLETPGKSNVLKYNILVKAGSNDHPPDISARLTFVYVEEEIFLRFHIPFFKVSNSPVFETSEINLNLHIFSTVHFFNNQKKYKPIPSHSL